MKNWSYNYDSSSECRFDCAEDVYQIWSKSVRNLQRYLDIREVYVQKRDFEKIKKERQDVHTKRTTHVLDDVRINTFRVRVIEIHHAQVKVDGCKYHLLQQNPNT